MEVREAPFGPALEAALVDAVFGAKRGYPFAPVTVVVPSLLAGVAARRAIAARAPVASVTTMTLAQLARSVLAVAGDHRPLMTGSVERELVRQALERWADRFGASDGHLGDGVIEAVVGALRALGAGEVRLDGAGSRDDGRRAALLAVRDELDRATGDLVPSAAVAALAARAVADPGGAALAQTFGAIVLYGVEPESYAGGDAALLAALDRVVPITAVRGAVGDDEDDRERDGDPDNQRLTIVVAPDPDVEIADAVSLLLAEAERGEPLHRMAIVATAADPWLTLAHQRLAASGISFNGRRPDRLSATPAARFLLGGLRLDRRLERDAVVAWWASAPIVWDGHAVASDRWAMLARLAGVVRGARQWRDRLDQLARAFEHPRMRRGGTDDEVPATAHWPWPTALDDVRAVREALEVTEVFVRDRGARRWSEHVVAATEVLDRFLGAPPLDVDGLAGVRSALGELAALDAVSPKPVTHSVFVSTLAGALDRSAGRVGTFGDGVFVGTLEETAGLPFTVVALVGLTDERLPAPSGEPPLIGELDATGAPERRARREACERRRLRALLAAPTCRLSFARTDPFAGRECLPSPWLLDLAAVVAGRPFSGEALAHLGASAAPPGIRSIESFASFLSIAAPRRTPIDRADFELAQVVSASIDGVGDIERHPYLEADHRRRRAVEAARSRAAAGFSEWDGAVGATGVDGLELVQRSPSGLEAYAACPRRYFYERVLDLSEVDDPIEERTVSARERGLLVHAALEALVEAEGDTAVTGHDRWSDTARAAAHGALDRACDDLERHGRTGTGLPWRLERRTLHLELERTIAHDDRLRVEGRFLPVAAEVQFGFDRPPATIDLVDGRRMEFHGYIDRVDASGDGRRVLVTDYKTGRAPTANEMREERRRGRRLQLPIYVLAARDLRPDAEAVEARDWYVSSRGNWEQRAVKLDDDTLDDLSRAVSIVVDGIEAGRFPARPGERDRDSFVNCRYCPFDRLCAADRDREWERVRSAPGLQAYARLAEGDLDVG